MIHFQNASVVFGAGESAHRAVNDLSLEMPAGKVTCLIGPSGSGKTTALKLINRLVEATEGQVLVDGMDVLSTDTIALRRSIGWVIQRGGLLPHRTVAQNIELLARLDGWPEKKRSERIDELLHMVELDPAVHRNRYPRELSGGQRQRVGIARALMLDPKIILMDEPFSALDPITRRQLHVALRELLDRVHKTVVLVTHDMPEAFALGDHLAILRNGNLVQWGTPDEVQADPADDFVRTFLDAFALERA